MLKPKVITQVLKQATTDGVMASLLMTNEGALIAFTASNDHAAKLYGAIAANVWSTYEQHVSRDVFLRSDPESRLRFVLMECEDGVVYVTSVGSMLLCLVGDQTVPLGLLKAKSEALVKHIQDPLSRVSTYLSTVQQA